MVETPPPKRVKPSLDDKSGEDLFNFSQVKFVTPTKKAGNQVFVNKTQAVGGRIIVVYMQKVKTGDEGSFTPHLLKALKEGDITLSVNNIKLVG